MKNKIFIILTIIIFNFILGFGQQKNDLGPNIDNKYKIAYNYLLNSDTLNKWIEGFEIKKVEGKPSIYVSDEVIHFSYVLFIRSILKYNYDIENAHLPQFDSLYKLVGDSLKNIDEQSYYSDESYPDLKKLSTSFDSQINMYFSKPINNTLICGFLYDKSKLRKYHSIIFMKVGLFFLFRFNSDNKIENVMIAWHSYD
jgi:hypothetical protein